MTVTVSFKTEDADEDDRPIGPVIVTNHEVYDNDPEIVKSRERGGFGIPFDYQPKGQTDLGWKTRREALAIAAEHGVTLTEW